ncbi:MAG: hypothetical protein KAT25_10080 [Sulfuriflexus sp.]|nr:hypothetical protein [Sulfuriflexus sp.]
MKNLDANIWSESYDLSVPLQIPLENGESLICEEVVRAMPGRRYVCRGTYAGKPVFVKLFSMNGQAKREWQDEQQGLSALKAAGIPAPEIIYFESSPDLSSRIIIFAELLGAESARHRWEHGNETARQMLAMQLVELMSRHHAAGIRQTDFHLLNFIFSEDVLYTLDAADIVKSALPLSRNNSMAGLADMLGLFDIKYDALLPSLYEHYWQCRESDTEPAELEGLSQQVAKLRKYKLRKYLDKIYRSCSEFIVENSWNNFSVYRRDIDSNNLRSLIKNPDTAQRKIIKDGNTCTVSLIEVPEQKLVCKRYNIKSAWHGLMRAFRVSRASRSWRNAYRLYALHIATPLPVGLVEQRFGPIRRKAWLFMPYIDGISAHGFFRDKTKIEQQHIAASQFATLFSKMVQAKLTHGDMKATNFIFSEDELFVIDLDSMQQHTSDASFAAAFRIDMQRFMRNWDELPDVAILFMEQLSTTSAAEFLPNAIKG